MGLFLENSDVERVLTMKVTLKALKILYKELKKKQTVFFPRQDLHVPLARPEEQLAAHYLKVMRGALAFRCLYVAADGRIAPAC